MLNCGVPLTPLNLLDNSDFRNPVNSRGITSTEASGYHIDRWKKENASGKVTVGNGYLSMTGTGAYWFLTQYIEPKKIKSGAVYTVALADTSGSVSVCSTVMSTDMAKFTARHTFTSRAVVMTNVEYTSDKYSVYFTSNSSAETRFAWAALYEGSYDASTLPAYQPKGYAAELAECQRYYYQTWDGAKPSSGAKIPGIQIRQAIAASRLVNVEFPVAMRITPTITLYTSDFIEGAVRNWNNSSDTVTGIIAVYGSTKGFVPGKEASDFTNGAPYSFHYSASADL